MILIVEDDANTRETLREVLEDEGYVVATARNGNEAAAQLAHTRPQLLILDLLMPGMSGTALFEEMKQDPELAKVPVLVTTSDPSRAPRGVPTLVKPLLLTRLLSLVAAATGRM